jgi:hypothetical protein
MGRQGAAADARPGPPRDTAAPLGAAGASLRFATDIRGILDPGEDWRIDEEAVARHLAGPNRPMPRGFIQGVELVPPGSVVTIDASGVRTDRWWRPRDLPELRHARDADYVEHLRDLLRQAIDARVDAELPIGTHLSGGIDSGAVCIAASDALAARGARLRAAYAWSPPVSDTFPELGRRDERRRIAPIAELAGTPLRFGRAECASLDHLDREIEFEGINNLDEELSVLGAAQGDGVRILLSGWGGDEGFSAHGYGSLAHLLRRGRLVAAFNSTRAHAGGRRHPVALLRALLAWGVAPLMPDPLYRRLAPFRDHYAEGSFQSARLKALPQDRGPYNGEDVRLTGDPRRYLADLVLMGHLSSRMETWGHVVGRAWGAVPLSAPRPAPRRVHARRARAPPHRRRLRPLARAWGHGGARPGAAPQGGKGERGAPRGRQPRALAPPESPPRGERFPGGQRVDRHARLPRGRHGGARDARGPRRHRLRPHIGGRADAEPRGAVERGRRGAAVAARAPFGHPAPRTGWTVRDGRV